MKIVGLLIIILLSSLPCKGQSLSFDDAVLDSKKLKYKDSIELAEKLDAFIKCDSKRQIESSISYFTDTRRFRTISNYTNVILPVVINYYKEVPFCGDLMALLSLPKDIKDSLLTFNKLSLRARARLGDTIAQNFYIQSFFQNLRREPFNEDAFSFSLEQLLYINSKVTSEVIFQTLQSDTIIKTVCEYYNEKNDLYYSLAYLIIINYRLMYLEEPIFNINYMTNFLFVDKKRDFGDSHKFYLKQIEAFINRTERKSVILRAPFLILGFCKGKWYL